PEHPSARSKFEPPAAARAASLAESSAASPAALLTVCEKSGYRASGRYDEVLALAQDFERRLGRKLRTELGVTPEGHGIALWSIAAESPGKPSILIQNAVHAGETAGKDT